MANFSSKILSRLTNNKAKKAEDKVDSSLTFEANGTTIESTQKVDVSEAVNTINREVEVFSNIDTKKLKQNIKKFRSLDYKNLTIDQLEEAAYEIVSENITSTFEIPEGEDFYRARSKTFTFQGAIDLFRYESEIWYPKPEYLTKLGRLNDIGQQLMYASLDALTPIHEIRSKNETQFALMKYKVKEGQSLRLATIAVDRYDVLARRLTKNVVWTKKGLENWKIINDFLYEEFTKRVPDGQEHFYKVTNALLRFFDVPDCDGYFYPSIERGGGYNLALHPASADQKVEFAGLGYFLNKYYDKKRVEKNDFLCFRRWSQGIEEGKIVYEPVQACKITFRNLGGGVLTDDEIFYDKDLDNIPSARHLLK